MDMEKLIEALKKARPGTVVIDATTGIFDPSLRGKMDSHLAGYDGWLVSTIRIVSPPPERMRSSVVVPRPIESRSSD